jgi:hypothetical protein
VLASPSIGELSHNAVGSKRMSETSGESGSDDSENGNSPGDCRSPGGGIMPVRKRASVGIKLARNDTRRRAPRPLKLDDADRRRDVYLFFYRSNGGELMKVEL